MSGMLGLFTGHSTLLVGVEDGPDGALKCYLGARWKGLYVLVTDEDDKAEVRRAWSYGKHVIFPTPPPELVLCDKPERACPAAHDSEEDSR